MAIERAVSPARSLPHAPFEKFARSRTEKWVIAAAPVAWFSIMLAAYVFGVQVVAYSNGVAR